MTTQVWTIVILVLIFFAALLYWELSQNQNLHVSDQEARLEKMMEYLKDNEEITNQEYRELVDVSEATATRDFDLAEEKDLIEQVGKRGHHVKYVLK